MHLNNLTERAAGEPVLVLGETTYRDRRERFGLLPQDRLRHLWLIGKTGTGKSTLLANMIRQDMVRGEGFALLDPHGDLVRAVLPFVPTSRTNDVLLFDAADTGYPISLNVFRAGRQAHPDPGLLASQLVSVFKAQWADSWGPRLEHVLRNAILAIVHDPRATLLFLYRFLIDERLRESVVPKIKDPVVRKFWEKEFPGYKGTLQSEATAPVLNKLGRFVSHPTVRNLIAQERSRVDLGAILERGGIILADLSSGAIGADASRLLGGLLLSSIQLAAMARQRGQHPFYVYADEFQNFVNDSLAVLLSEARKFGVGLVMAHQYLGQLPDSVREATLGNAGTKIAFRIGALDAEEIAPEFAPVFAAEDLMALPNYQMYVKLLARGSELRAFSAESLPPPEPANTVDASVIRRSSRERFAQPRAVVEAAVQRAIGASRDVDDHHALIPGAL